MIATPAELDLPVAVDGDTVRVGGAAVVDADLIASNGVLHAIDAVLEPPVEPPLPETVVDVLAADGRFGTLIELVVAAGLADALQGQGPFTVFAPTDEQFAVVPAEVLDFLANNPAALAAVLTAHVGAGDFDSAAVVAADGDALPSLNEDAPLTVEVGEGILISGVPLGEPLDLRAQNGVVHTLDGVIVPDGILPQPLPETVVDVLAADGRFGTLIELVVAAGLADALQGEGPFTVFAPTDEQFAAVPADVLDFLANNPAALAAVLTAHVGAGNFDSGAVVAADGDALPSLNEDAPLTVEIGEGILISGVPLGEPLDLRAQNGVVHTLDGVIVPDGILPQPLPETVVDVLAADGRFGTLIELVVAAGLADALQGEGPFTVFAPTDEQFAAVPADVLDFLANNPAALAAVLTAHVGAGNFDSGAVVAADGDALPSLNEEAPLTVELGEGILISGVPLGEPLDLRAQNGVVHTLDGVIVPDGILPVPLPETVVDVLAADGRFGTLIELVVAAGLADALQGEGPFTVFAPTDEQFAAVPAEVLDFLANNPAALAAVLTAHVGAGNFDSGAVVAADGDALPSLNEDAPLTVELGEGILISGVPLGEPLDLRAQNGVVHTLDGVIVPDGILPVPLPETVVDVLAADGRFGTLIELVVAAGLADALQGEGPFTVFAPTDEQFAAVPAEVLDFLANNPAALAAVLTAHVGAGGFDSGAVVAADGDALPSLNEDAPLTVEVGEGILISGVPLGEPLDLRAQNGVVHTLDGVIVPDGILPQPLPETVVDVLAADGRFGTLIELVVAAGLADALQGEGPFTVFAPTDEQFAAVPAEVLDFLANNPAALAAVLTAHVGAGNFDSGAVVAADGDALPSLNEEAPLTIEVGEGILVSGVPLGEPLDLRAQNGVVHTLDGVIVPDGILPPVGDGTCAEPLAIDGFGQYVGTTAGAGALNAPLEGCSGFDGAGEASEIVYRAVFDEPGAVCLDLTGSTFDTVLFVRSAPCDAADSEVACNDDSQGLLQSALEFEAMAGAEYFVFVDGFGDAAGEYLLDVRPGPCVEPPTTIVDVLAADGRFGTLVDLVAAAGLVDALESEGPFTVFAPTDDAFAAVPPAVLDFLAANPDALIAVLTAHVVAGDFDSAAVVAADGDTLPSINPEAPLTVEVGDEILIGGVPLGAPLDLVADNGVVHTLDGVIVPDGVLPPATVVDVLAADGRFGTLIDLVVAAGLVEALQGEGPFTVFAPTDDQFAALPVEVTAFLTENRAALAAVLTAHVGAGAFDAEAVVAADGDTLPSLNPEAPLAVEVGEGITISGAPLGEPLDLLAENGVVHTLAGIIVPDGILPPDLVPAGTCGDPLLLPGVGRFGGSTAGRPADNQPVECGFDGSGAAAEAVYRFVVPEAGTWCFDTDGSSYDTTLFVRTAPCGEQGSQIGCNDDSPLVSDLASALTVDLEAATEYFVFVDGFDDAAGDYTLNVRPGACDQAPPAATVVEALAADGRFGTLIGLVEQAGLVEALEGPGPFTVFAPTDAVFAALSPTDVQFLADNPDALAAVLTAHVGAGAFDSAAVLAADGDILPSLNVAAPLAVSVGEVITISGAPLGDRLDILADNGVVHTLDGLITPPGVLPEHIVRVLQGDGRFDALLTALAAAGLTDALAGIDGATLFAPTDEAFAALGPDTVDALLANRPRLFAILAYHVVQGVQDAAAVLAAAELESAIGVPVPVDPLGPTVGGQPVEQVDIGAANGIIHALGGVMAPPGLGTCALPLPLFGGEDVLDSNVDNPAEQGGSCRIGGVDGSGPELVYDIELAADGTVCASTVGSSFDTVLYVRADACLDGPEVACQDDIGGGTLQSQVQFEAEAGTRYFVIVDGYRADSEGQTALSITEGPCP